MIHWKILLIDDDEEDYLLTRLMLSKLQGAECELEWASSFEAGQNMLHTNAYDAVLVDYYLDTGKGPDLIHEAAALGCSAPFILLTGQGSYEIDLEAMQAGATLYLAKGEVKPHLLERTIRYAIEYKRILQELKAAHDGLELKIQERTAEMARINRELRAEIATRRSTESALLASESHLKQVISQIPAILWTTNRDFTLTSLLGSLSNEIQYQLEDLLNQQSELFSPSTNGESPIERAHRKALLGGGADFEISLGGRDYHCTVEAFRNQDGEVDGCLGIALDITAWKRSEEIIRLQSTALEAAADGILITDPMGVIRWCNSALTAMTGYSISEMVGKTTGLFKSGRHSREFYSALWDTITSGRVWRGEIWNRRKDGNLYVEEQTITPVVDSNGKISHFIAIKHDITDRKEAEEKIKQRNWELQALNTISSALTSSLDLGSGFPLVQQLLYDELAIAAGGVFSYDPERDLFNQEYSWNYSVSQPEGYMFSDADHQRAVQAKKPVFASLPDPTDEEFSRPAQANFLCIPLLSEGETQGVLDLYLRGSKINSVDGLGFLESLGNLIGVATHNARLFKEVQDNRAHLQALSRRLVHVQEMERRYIARELHDETGQALIGLTFALENLKQDANDSQAVAASVDLLDHLISNILTNLHQLAVDLRPTVLDHLGLMPAIRQYANGISEKYGIVVHLEVPELPNRLPSEMETTIFRITQEALTNVVRHANATRADIQVEVLKGKIQVIFMDNGSGFNLDEALSKERLGLFGMSERAEMLGGRLVVDSAPGQGTRISLEIPYDL
jgi:PAS domain S-box-containing protein